MWKIISFLCTLSRLHFLYRDCIFFFSSHIHHQPLPPSLPNETGRPASSPTAIHTSLSPPSISIPSFSLFSSLSTSPRENKAMAMVENQGRREKGAASCHWRRQLATLAVIDGGGRSKKKISIWSLKKSIPHSISGKIHSRLISEKIHAKPPRKTKKNCFFFLLPVFSGSILGVSLLLCHWI